MTRINWWAVAQLAVLTAVVTALLVWAEMSVL
jgi:hypothetical protein